jgi:hypothetical protein
MNSGVEALVPGPTMEIEQMNRHEHFYRRTGRALYVLLGLWITAMLLVLVIPSKLWKTGLPSLILFDGIFPVLFVAIVVLSVLRMVAYIRWTGKYPYYFLFGKAHGSGDAVDKGQEGVSSEKNGSA